MTMLLAAAGLATLCAVFAARARRLAANERLVADLVGAESASPAGSGVGREVGIGGASGDRDAQVITVAAALLGVACGMTLAGAPGAVAGGVAGASIPRVVERRRAARTAAAVDRQVGEFADAVASAVRGGLSISQAVEFAAEEAESPLADATGALLQNRATGLPLTEALERFADSVATDEAKLLALVLGVHHRSGGNVASALEEITATIRHRLDLRRELRALTAQGRISGYILGILPVAFFAVLSVTSRGQLSPVVRSPAGVVLVSAGLALDGLAYVWIRRLLRVEV